MGRKPVGAASMPGASRQMAYITRLRAGGERAAAYAAALRDVIACTHIKDARAVAEAALNQPQKEQ